MQVKKVHSGKKILLRNTMILLGATIVCILTVSFYSVWTYEKQLVFCNEAAINIFSENLEEALNDALNFNQSIYANNPYFQILAIDESLISPNWRLTSIYNLKQVVGNRSREYETVMVFNESGRVFYFSSGSEFLNGVITDDSMGLLHEISEYLMSCENKKLQSWQLYKDGDDILLMNAYRYRDMYICSIIDLQAFSDIYGGSDDSIQYVFYNKNEILTNKDYVNAKGISLERLRSSEGDDMKMSLSSNIVHSVYYPSYGIGISVLISTEGIWSYLPIFLLIIAAALTTVVVMFCIIYSIFNRMLIYPMEQITRMSRHLSDPDYQLPAKKNQRNLLEFEEIRTSLVGLMDQKNKLEKENLKRTQEKDRALLQYFQLQTRSHFFLNCLKSIYNMTENGENEKTKLMITLFSKHLRYIFHDNISLVKLSEEIEETQDYYQILQLDSKHPILLEMNVDESLLNCRVPALCIQTFLENSNKHNISSNKILKFSVKIDRVEMENGQYIRIRLSDNGVGYTDEVLQKLSVVNEEFEQYNIGINNLQRRIRLIYKNNYQMAFYNLQSGGACTVIYLPIERNGDVL